MQRQTESRTGLTQTGSGGNNVIEHACKDVRRVLLAAEYSAGTLPSTSTQSLTVIHNLWPALKCFYFDLVADRCLTTIVGKWRPNIVEVIQHWNMVEAADKMRIVNLVSNNAFELYVAQHLDWILKSFDVSTDILQGMWFWDIKKRARQQSVEANCFHQVWLRPPANMWRDLRTMDFFHQ